MSGGSLHKASIAVGTTVLTTSVGIDRIVKNS